MGLETAAIIGIVGATVAAGGTAASIVQGNKARADARSAADDQKQAQDVVLAQNAQQQAEQQRQQVRDARVKQARILQGASNSGADQSSGELGAIGAVATNLSNNQGQSLGADMRSQQIGNLNQQAADATFDSRQDSQLGQEFAQFGQIGSSIFSTASKSPAGAKAINSIFN